jgi:hypothetical protein
MGRIRITTNGSFPEIGVFEVCAEQGGHAFALHRAIAYLNRQFPKAIQLDHQLQAKGEHPPEADFGETPNTASG